MHGLVGVSISILVLASCADTQEVKAPPGGANAVTGESSATNQLANPAATYCIETGGEYEITKAADGSEAGVCTLTDGTRMDAWEYFRSQTS